MSQENALFLGVKKGVFRWGSVSGGICAFEGSFLALSGDKSLV